MISRILLGIGWLAVAITAFFLVAGLANGSVNAVNGHYWLLLVCFVGGLHFGALNLRASGKYESAAKLQWILAVPTILFVLFAILITISPLRWN